MRHLNKEKENMILNNPAWRSVSPAGADL